ncbi:MAG: LuxR family transcriptional regulator [Frankiales bacterium]|nr:LuxR family transcriptional regulator [Frankiales bacterium]
MDMQTGAVGSRSRTGTSESPRPRLHALLDAAAGKPLTLLSAGPGWGKTTVLTNWPAPRAAPMTWVTVDETRNNEADFWGAVIAAVDAQELLGSAPAAAGRSTAVRAGVAPIAEHALGLLVDVLEAWGHLLLIVDDAQLLTDSKVRQALDSIVQYPIPGLRIVLAARSDPLLPLHRYRLEDRVAEIRAAELAMNVEETAEVLRAHGITFDTEDVEELLDRTLGWPAAVQLAALNFASAVPAERGELRRRLRSLRAPELMDSVLDGLPPEQLRMLVDVSILREVSEGLADALSGRADSRLVLEGLASSNFFITPLDREQQWFRFHPMLQENLSRRRETRDPANAAALRQRAASWFETQGLLVSAMEQHALAEDWLALAQLLIGGGFAQSLASGGIGLGQLLTGLARAVLPAGLTSSQRIALRAARGVARIMNGEVELAREDLASVLSSGHLPTEVALVARYVETELLYLDAGEARVRELLAVEDANAGPGPPSVVAAASYANLAALQLWTQPFPAPTASLTLAWQACREAGAVVHELRCLGLLTFAHAQAGQLRLAATFEAVASTSIRRFPALNGRGVMAVQLGSAALALQRGEWDRCRRAIERVRATSWSPTDEPLAAAARCIEAKLLMSQGQPAQGLSLLPDSDAAQPLLAIRNLCDEAFEELAIASGQTGPGSRLAARRLARGNPELTLRAADVQFARGDVAQASALISETLAAIDPPAQLPTMVDALLLTAAVAHFEGRAAVATDAARRAVELAPDGVRLPFYRRAAQLAGLLVAQPALAAIWPIASRVAEPTRRAVARPREALTARERGILTQLAGPMSLAEVAATLGISVNTVKTHSAALYRKLGVSRRRDAVARGYELGLLQLAL